VVADTATAQDTLGIIAAEMTIAMETEATEVDTVGAAIATKVVGIIGVGTILTFAADSEIEDFVTAT
jgi:hypothetical protein